jgi:cytochrome c-type biogenesis protein CcsB
MSGALINYSFLVFIVASFAYATNNFTKREYLIKFLGYAGSLSLVVGVVLMTAAIMLRWQEAQRAPFSNMYESLILFAWSIALIYLVLELIYKIRIAGAFAAILAVVAIAAASFFDETVEPLMPALQSNWLFYHVLTCFVGYAAFAISAGAALVYMYQKLRHVYNIGSKAIHTVIIFAVVLSVIAMGGYFHYYGSRMAGSGGRGPILTLFVGDLVFMIVLAAGVAYLFFTRKGETVKETNISESKRNIFRALEAFIYEAVRFGFLFLGIGIITGAVWANEAWGTYWSWDPKETWSLITWIIYAIMIHFKYVSGRFGIKDINTFNAVCSNVGFQAVIITYVGVNFLISGLHSYA